MSGVDKVNIAIGVVGIALTIVGFWIALVQLSRTKTAAVAARDAVTTGTERIRYNQLLMLVPQMQSLEVELDLAIQQDDAMTGGRVLLRWRQLAATAHGILGPMGPSYEELVTMIDRTRGNAIQAKGRLSEPGGRAVSALVSGVRKEVAVVNDRLGSIVGQLSTEIQGGADNHV